MLESDNFRGWLLHNQNNHYKYLQSVEQIKCLVNPKWEEMVVSVAKQRILI